MKTKNKILTLLTILGVGGALALAPLLNAKETKTNNNNVVLKQVNKKYVSYNDSSKTITLTAEEVNNYTFVNLQSYCNEVDDNFVQQDWEGSSVSVNGVELPCAEEALYYTNFSYFFGFNLEPNLLMLTDDSDQQVTITTDVVFEFGLTPDSSYTGFKNAIELDIEANTPTPMGESITGAVTSGLGLIGSLTREFITGFSALLWNSTSNTLTNFGTFALVFLGIAITMAIIKLVLVILRGNTGA